MADERFLARDVFVITNRRGRAIAVMFVRLSVHLSGTAVHYQTVHYSVDLSLRLDNPMSWTL